MDKVKIDNLVDNFERYKKYLSENYKLDTGEAALLATKFLDLEDKETHLIFQSIKNKLAIIPYYTPYIKLIVDDIREGKSQGFKVANTKVSVEIGRTYHQVVLTGKQSITFLALLALKYERYEECMISGFSMEDISYRAYDLLNLIDKDHKNSDYLIGRRDFTNMATKFSNRDALHIIKTMNTNKRIDVLASMIKFRPEALDAFEKITNHSLSLFCEQIGTPLYQGMTKA